MSCSLFAQEKKEPAQRDAAVPEQTGATLPKIDLPEFLITGQETIDLPVSSKSVAEDEKVFVPGSPSLSHKDASAVASVKQQKDFTGRLEQMNGKVLAGIGNYTSPFLEGWFGKNYSEGGVLFHANFASSNGHVANANRQKTGIGIHGDYFSPQSFGIIAGSRLNGGINFSGESYRAYGSAIPSQLRTLSNVRINLGLASRTTNIEKPDEALDYSTGISWNGVSLNDSLNSSENEFGLFAAGSTHLSLWERNNIQLRGTMEYAASGVSMPFPFPKVDDSTRRGWIPTTIETHSPQWFALRLSGKTFISPTLQASLTLQQFVYRGTFSTTSGRFFPNIDLRYFMNDAATLFAGFAPTVERNTLGGIIKSNKYIRNAVELQPSEIPLSFNAGAEISFNEKLRGKGSFSYRTIKNFPAFIEFISAKVWDVMYLSDVNVASFEAQGSYLFSQKNSATLTALFNSTQEKDSSNTVPNVPAFTMSGVYRHSFDNSIAIEMNAEYVSKRWTDFAYINANAAYINLGGKGEYQLFDNLRAVARVSNLLNQQYYVWNGYVERPLFISLGVTYKW